MGDVMSVHVQFHLQNHMLDLDLIPYSEASRNWCGKFYFGGCWSL
jgi:hypothetical protein